MFQKNSLKTKLSLFLIVFTIILASSFIGYTVWFGRQNIRIRAEQDLRLFAGLFESEIKKEIVAAQHELDGLITQLGHLQLMQETNIETVSDEIWAVERFIAGYSEKYSEIILTNRQWPQFISVQPVMVIGGEKKIQIQIKDQSILADPVRQIIKSRNYTSKLIGPDYRSSAGIIYLITTFDPQSDYVLIAAIPINHLLDNIMNRLHLPEVFYPYITDTSGIVLYSREEKYRLQNINRILPDLTFITKNSDAADYHINSERHIIKVCMHTPELCLFLKKQVDRELSELHAVAGRMLLFGLLILIIVSLFTRYLTHRLTSTFQQISQTSDSISAGDFSKKINIKRNDELGAMIVSFNAMVDRLDESYRALNIANDELRQKISELNRTKTELSQKQRLALIGETVSKISHEIQNKIGGVSVWVQNLEIFMENNETIEEYIFEIKSALNSFMEMLTNFKRFYREPELNLVEFEIREFIDSIVKQFANQARSNQVELKIIRENNCGMILADKEHLEKVLANLILNAIFYAPQSSEIIIDSHLEKDRFLLSVTDRGPGIKDDIADKIFQPFFTTKASGSGLGLAMVHSIVSAHMGEISFKNNPNGGACFTIKLPIKPMSAVNKLS